jgi:hypothetical protein
MMMPGRRRNAVSQPPSIFRVRAHNTAPDSENKIHDDRVAAAYGFRGGLVPGVTVYGYMVPAIVEQLGRDWLARGSANFRLVAPCYEGETVVTRCNGSAISAEREDGSLYASGTVSMNGDTPAVGTPLPYTPPPPDQRPAASPGTVVPGRPLGSIRRTVETANEIEVPECLLHWANQILMANFVMSTWIHAGSHVRHHRLPAHGEELEIRGTIQECFERKGRRFAVACLSFFGGDGPSAGELIASVRHTFIYELGR